MVYKYKVGPLPTSLVTSFTALIPFSPLQPHLPSFLFSFFFFAFFFLGQNILKQHHSLIKNVSLNFCLLKGIAKKLNI